VEAAHAKLRPDASRYERHRPETTLLYQLVERHYPGFVAALTARGRTLPAYVHDEFEAYLKCGRLAHGFLRVRCTACHAERLVAYSCKRRGFCPSCAARRMTESAALLIDEVLPREPVRQKRAGDGCAKSIPQRENPTRTPAFPVARQGGRSPGRRYRGSPALRRGATLSAAWAFNFLFPVLVSTLVTACVFPSLSLADETQEVKDYRAQCLALTRNSEVTCHN